MLTLLIVIDLVIELYYSMELEFRNSCFRKHRATLFSLSNLGFNEVVK